MLHVEVNPVPQGNEEYYYLIPLGVFLIFGAFLWVKASHREAKARKAKAHSPAQDSSPVPPPSEVFGQSPRTYTFSPASPAFLYKNGDSLGTLPAYNDQRAYMEPDNGEWLTKWREYKEMMAMQREANVDGRNSVPASPFPLAYKVG